MTTAQLAEALCLFAAIVLAVVFTAVVRTLRAIDADDRPVPAEDCCCGVPGCDRTGPWPQQSVEQPCGGWYCPHDDGLDVLDAEMDIYLKEHQ